MKHSHAVDGGQLVHDHDDSRVEWFSTDFDFESHRHLIVLVAANYVNEKSGPMTPMNENRS